MLSLVAGCRLRFSRSRWFNLFGDIMNGTQEMTLLSVLPALYFPLRYHINQQHRQALGAAYAAPLVFMMVFFGLLLDGTPPTARYDNNAVACMRRRVLYSSSLSLTHHGTGASPKKPLPKAKRSKRFSKRPSTFPIRRSPWKPSAGHGPNNGRGVVSADVWFVP